MKRLSATNADPNDDSPLSFAVSERDKGTLAMVQAAVERGDVALAFQPIVSSRSGNAVAFYEGLLRVLDETGRVIPARDFIGAVEDRELGRQLDCIALRLGLRALRANPDLRLSINLSARSVGWPNWMNILRKHIRQHPMAVERLILEITESSAVQMPEIVTVFMEELQDKGVTFAIDDFGAGFTAFRYFKDFCFDILKIDGQFSRNVARDPDNQVLTEAMLSIARHFDMMVVSESVESAADAEWLTRCGVDCMQGYFFGAPSMTPPWKPPAASQALSA